MSKPVKKNQATPRAVSPDYSGLVSDVSGLLEAARRASVRTVNAFMTATYWEVGRRIVEFEQGGEKRAGYGEELLDRLATDLNSRFGRGFSRRNLQSMRQFYGFAPVEQIWQTLTAKLATQERLQAPSGESTGGKKRTTTTLDSDKPPIAQTLSAQFT